MSNNTKNAATAGAADVAALNRLRLEDDISYAELGAQIGIDAGALYRILSGKSEPIDRTLYKIRRFLETRPSKRRAS